MSYDNDSSEGYLSDGVYSDWWNWVSDSEVDAKERRSQKHSLLVERLSIQWLRSVDSPSYSASEFLNSMFKSTILTGSLLAAKRYCRVESISLKYADAIFRECKAADIIVSKLKEYNLFKSVEDIRRLDIYIEELKEHRSDLTAYLKVYEIQLLIHREMQLRNGENSHLNMEKRVMRETLSILRLFFLTDEAKKINFDGFVRYLSQQKKTIELAKLFTPKYVLESTSEYNKNWNLKHQHSLLYYFPEDMREFIKKLIKLRSERSKHIIHEGIRNKVTDYHINK